MSNVNGAGPVCPEAVIGQVMALLDDIGEADRSATRAAREAAADLAHDRIAQMRAAADTRYMSGMVGAVTQMASGALTVASAHAAAAENADAAAASTPQNRVEADHSGSGTMDGLNQGLQGGSKIATASLEHGASEHDARAEEIRQLETDARAREQDASAGAERAERHHDRAASILDQVLTARTQAQTAALRG
jgi:hypothetical protein